MRRILVEYAEPGMINARAIHNSEGKVLLAAGTELNDYYINRLNELGIQSLYIRDETTGGLTIPETVSERTRVETIKIIRQAFTQLEDSRRINMPLIKNAVDKILDEVLGSSNALIHLVDIRAYDDYTFAHSVNVCILSLMTGISLSYNTQQLRELGIGALLHDIGKTRIPKEILDKPSCLTPAEFQEMQKHACHGFEILRHYPEIPLLSSHVALQHHERVDGSGYPRQLKGDEIHEYAKITAVTDVYDALLADRIYRPAFLPYGAIRELTRGTYTFFDPRVVAAFLENVAIYPVGSLVQLNTGDVGIVVDVNKQSQHRPVIRMLLDRHGRKPPEGQEHDLDKMPTIYITKVFGEKVSDSILRNLKKGIKIDIEKLEQEVNNALG
jgi:HD-GYP domain-containing protein (c-di-GMP phosphodiesterase class II)